MEAIIGKLYSWKDVEEHWGGEQTYLAKRGGRIICATLDQKKNPDAPEVMVVGHKPRNSRRGEEFCNQKEPVPLFIKEAKNKWRYKGRYGVAGFTTDQQEIRRFENGASGSLSRVIFLKPADNQDELSIFPDIDDDACSAPEGRKQWVQHFRRERNRGLVAAKKRQVLSNHGRLACEVCDFNFTTFYQPYAASFCEVHHRRMLSELEEGAATKLGDLAILCSNCHRVIHLIKPMPSVEVFRKILMNDNQ